jgi:polyphosphate kinase
MDEQIDIARSGGSGYIAAKINSLSDRTIIDKLVEASQAGVKVELVVRGICCLVPGVQGYTENITVRSIVGRFLEHSRIFIFGKDSKAQKMYIGSADYMSRNTIRRVEVAAPIEDERLKKRIRELFRTLMEDNVKARVMNSDGSYSRVAMRRASDVPLNSQEALYDDAYKRLSDRQARQERLKTNLEKRTAKKPASGRKKSAPKTSAKKKSSK